VKFPAITDDMVDEILEKTHAIFNTADRKELKVAFSHFFESIEIDGKDVTIEYSFKKQTIVNVFTNGDPGRFEPPTFWLPGTRDLSPKVERSNYI
jgi:hypothetical protein